MWMPAQTTDAALAHRGSARGTSSPAGAKMIALSSSTGGRFVGPARPHRAQLAREAPPGSPRVTHVAPPARVARHLDHDVRRGAEAVQAEPRRPPQPLHLRQPQRPIADQPGAQQRRRLHVGVVLRQRQTKSASRDRVLRVAAVGV